MPDKARNEFSDCLWCWGRFGRNEAKFTAVEFGILAGLSVIYIEKLLTTT